MHVHNVLLSKIIYLTLACALGQLCIVQTWRRRRGACAVRMSIFGAAVGIIVCAIVALTDHQKYRYSLRFNPQATKLVRTCGGREGGREREREGHMYNTRIVL